MYIPGMDNDTLRVVLAAALGPIVWMPVHWLVDKYKQKHAARDAMRRLDAMHSSYHFGKRMAARFRRLIH